MKVAVRKNKEFMPPESLFDNFDYDPDRDLLLTASLQPDDMPNNVFRFILWQHSEEGGFFNRVRKRLINMIDKEEELKKEALRLAIKYHGIQGNLDKHKDSEKIQNTFQKLLAMKMRTHSILASDAHKSLLRFVLPCTEHVGIKTNGLWVLPGRMYSILGQTRTSLKKITILPSQYRDTAYVEAESSIPFSSYKEKHRQIGRTFSNDRVPKRIATSPILTWDELDQWLNKTNQKKRYEIRQTSRRPKKTLPLLRAIEAT